MVAVKPVVGGAVRMRGALELVLDRLVVLMLERRDEVRRECVGFCLGDADPERDELALGEMRGGKDTKVGTDAEEAGIVVGGWVAVGVCGW